MTIWIDAQLSPVLAGWISDCYEDIEATPVRAVGLRDAEDEEIFRAAREADGERIAVMSKDSDFLDLLDQSGPPPKILWVTCGNTSNRRMKQILNQRLEPAVALLESGEALVEISDL